jgi:hypothetical protein
MYNFKRPIDATDAEFRPHRAKQKRRLAAPFCLLVKFGDQPR